MTPRDALWVEPLSVLDERFDACIFPKLRAPLREPKPNRLLLGLWIGDRPAGLAYGGHTPQEGIGWLVSLYIDPPLRRRGGGSLLLAAAESAWRAAGCTGLGVRVSADAPGTAAVLALLRRHGWQAPTLSMVNLICEAGPIHDSVSTWPAIVRWLTDPGRYSFDPWSEPSAADAVAIERLRAQASFQEPMDPVRYREKIDPVCSLAVRRQGALVGWVLAVPLSGAVVAPYGERIARNYVAAYLDEPLWSTGALIAAYCIAFGRQVEAYGRQSLAMYYSTMPRMQALTRRRFARFALKFSEILEVQKPLA